jgi:hypothetical protein
MALTIGPRWSRSYPREESIFHFAAALHRVLHVLHGVLHPLKGMGTRLDSKNRP